MTTPNLHNPRPSTEVPPLPAEDHFECLPGCGLCCSYRVLLTNADLGRIQEIEPVIGPPQTWLEDPKGDPALGRAEDFCVFLQPDYACSIYEQRPQHCRTFPYLNTAYHSPEIDVDFSCPGLGFGPRDSISRLAALEGENTRPETLVAGVKEVESLLQAQGRFAGPEVLPFLANRAIELLYESWSSDPPTSLHVSQPAPLRVNATTEAHADEIWPGLRWTPHSQQQLLADEAWIKRHFSPPRWSTSLGTQGVTGYRFWIAEGLFYLEARDQPLQTANLNEIEGLAWEPEALELRRAYLIRWFKRQSIIRLSANLAVARMLQGDHLATCYLSFLMEIDHRLAVLAPALASIRRKWSIDRETTLEAVRGSDGLLRAWCESARLGMFY